MTDTSGNRSELRIGFRPGVCGPIYAVPSGYWLPILVPPQKSSCLPWERWTLPKVAQNTRAEQENRTGEQNRRTEQENSNDTQ